MQSNLSPDQHLSEIDYYSLYGKNEGLAKQQAISNANDWLANATTTNTATQQDTTQDTTSSNNLDIAKLLEKASSLLKKKSTPDVATPTYVS